MTLNPCLTLVCRQNTVYSLGIFIGVAEQVCITPRAYSVNYSTFTCLPLVVEGLKYSLPFQLFRLPASFLAAVMHVEQHLHQCTYLFEENYLRDSLALLAYVLLHIASCYPAYLTWLLICTIIPAQVV